MKQSWKLLPKHFQSFILILAFPQNIFIPLMDICVSFLNILAILCIKHVFDLNILVHFLSMHTKFPNHLFLTLSRHVFFLNVHILFFHHTIVFPESIHVFCPSLTVVTLSPHTWRRYSLAWCRCGVFVDSGTAQPRPGPAGGGKTYKRVVLRVQRTLSLVHSYICPLLF